MENKKIPTWLGTSVIIIIAITVVMFVWKFEKNKQNDLQTQDRAIQQKTALVNKKQQYNNAENTNQPETQKPTEEVSFCEKIYKSYKLIVNDVDIIKTIANISQKNNWICKNMELGNFQKSGIDVAQKEDSPNIISLFHTGDTKEEKDPFNQSPYIFEFDFKNNKVFYQDQFDGKFNFIGTIK